MPLVKQYPRRQPWFRCSSAMRPLLSNVRAHLLLPRARKSRHPVPYVTALVILPPLLDQARRVPSDILSLWCAVMIARAPSWRVPPARRPARVDDGYSLHQLFLRAWIPTAWQCASLGARCSNFTLHLRPYGALVALFGWSGGAGQSARRPRAVNTITLTRPLRARRGLIRYSRSSLPPTCSGTLPPPVLSLYFFSRRAFAPRTHLHRLRHSSLRVLIQHPSRSYRVTRAVLSYRLLISLSLWAVSWPHRGPIPPVRSRWSAPRP